MKRRDPRIDACIAAAAPFVQPLLMHLRSQVHAACPEADKTLKWGMPVCQLMGKVQTHMAACRAHCGFRLLRGRGVAGPAASDDAMDQFGRIAGLADLVPPAELQTLIAQAAALMAAPRKKRDDTESIVEAKRAETRDKRVAQAVEWLLEGKVRNCKYAGC